MSTETKNYTSVTPTICPNCGKKELFLHLVRTRIDNTSAGGGAEIKYRATVVAEKCRNDDCRYFVDRSTGTNHS